jgi:hypothetical protein
MSEVGVGRKRLKDINRFVLFVILEKIKRACLFGSGGNGVMQVKMS